MADFVLGPKGGVSGAAAAAAGDEPPMTREEQEQEMLQALELLKQVDPERYQALLTEMAAAVNPGGGLEKRFDWRCGLSPHTCLALTSLRKTCKPHQ